MNQWRTLIIGILIGLLVGGLIFLISKPPTGEPIVLKPAPTSTKTSEPRPTPTPQPIFVQINGEIAAPGIYALDQDARLSNLIELAGGLTENADEKRVNQASLLQDGDYFYIPRNGEDVPETARNAFLDIFIDQNPSYDYPLDLNSATQDALESLPGIGPTKASSIINYREQNGPFLSIEELMNVEGIGQETFANLKDLITVGQ